MRDGQRGLLRGDLSLSRRASTLLGVGLCVVSALPACALVANLGQFDGAHAANDAAGVSGDAPSETTAEAEGEDVLADVEAEVDLSADAADVSSDEADSSVVIADASLDAAEASSVEGDADAAGGDGAPNIVNAGG